MTTVFYLFIENGSLWKENYSFGFEGAFFSLLRQVKKLGYFILMSQRKKENTITLLHNKHFK